MTDIHIRKYQNADWSAVLQLIIGTMEFHMSIQNPVFFHKYNVKMLADFLRSLTAKHRKSQGLLLVATNQKNNQIGFIYGEVDKKEGDYADNAVKSGSIEEVYVVEDARLHGVASRLFDEMESWLKQKGCTLIRLTGVHLSNAAAQSMYEKRGYIVRVMEYAKKV